MKGERAILALFKIAKGNRERLPLASTEGCTYFTTDTGEFYIDIADSSEGTKASRIMLNGMPYVQGIEENEEGAWKGEHPGLNLRDGLTLIYKPVVDGSALASHSFFADNENINLIYTCFNLNDLGWKKCFLNNKPLKNEIEKNSIILMTYDKDLDDGNGAWNVLGNQINNNSFEGHNVVDEITEENLNDIPTVGAIKEYIESLSYNGDYETSEL